MIFEIIDTDVLGRIGKITINGKKLLTPNLFPVVHPYYNLISPKELEDFGVQSIFTNAYIIYKNRQMREEVLSKGIHQYLKFNGLIATDSGAFQKYMYSDMNNIEIDASTIEKFQEDIGSDFPVILDLPVQLTDNYETAKNKVITTIARAKDNIRNRSNPTCNWFGPIHGGKYNDLLRLSIQEMSKLDFNIYAIGGLVKSFLEYRFDLPLQILINAKKELISNKPIHMFGLGLPQFFSLAVAYGCDLMDSAAYILFAKENRYFTLSTGTKNLNELEEFPCHCPICSKYTPKEVKDCDEDTRITLLAKHNLYLSFSELKAIRQAIREGNLWELLQIRIRSHPNLVKAMELIKQNESFFEIHEKIYKKHGRLYTSDTDLYRPSFYRYLTRLIKNYRIPEETKFLIILPELDAKEVNSPSIQIWIEQIEKNIYISRKQIDIMFLSIFYGLIPYDLSNTFPLGQFEAIDAKGINDSLYQNSLMKVKLFFKTHMKSYKKCGILIPNLYLNQYNEEVRFSINHPIYGINSFLKSEFELEFSIFNNTEEICQFFKKD